MKRFAIALFLFSAMGCKPKVKSAEFASMGRNTPFEGWELKGLVLLTMLGGKVTYRAQPLEVSAR